MKKRVLSILLSFCMVLTIVPAAVFAVGSPAYTGTGGAEASAAETQQAAAEKVQALINALPNAGTITAGNRENVENQLTAIDEAAFLLDDEVRDTLDFSKYSAAVAALNALDGMEGAEIPYVLADTYLDVGDKTFENVTSTTSYSIGSGTATYDPKNVTLTLDKVTITSSKKGTAAINSNIPNLEIVLKGESKITITNESMAALCLLSNATISGADSNSKLTIESTGKNNKGIRAAAALTISGTSLTIVDKTTAAASKGYMLGILPSGNLSMTNVKYTATGVLAAIDFDANCTSTLTNVEFQVSCTANQSFDIDDPTTMAIGVHMMKPASGKNTITGCSGSITAQIPLYVDGETELKNSNLTLTTDNYYAINLNNNLTISGGTVNLKSTGSGAYGFYLKNASNLVFADSTNVTLAVDSVGIMVKTAAASVAINSGTVNMSPKAGAAKPIGIYNCGTVTVSGGSLITTGIYSAIQNLRTVSFSGGTHTLNTSDSGVCYIDDASDDTLSISGNANVTLSGGAMNTLCREYRRPLNQSATCRRNIRLTAPWARKPLN